MMGSGSPEVTLQCAGKDRGVLRDPVPVAEFTDQKTSRGELDEEQLSAAREDFRVRDAFRLGWCVFPPENIVLSPDSKSEFPLSPKMGGEYVRLYEKVSDSGVAGVIDSLWSVSVSEGYKLYVCSPLFDPEPSVRTQVIDASDGFVPLEVPFVTRSAVGFHFVDPLVQVFPIRVEDLGLGVETGVMDEDAQQRRNRALGLFDLYHDPYRERVHVPKPGATVSNGPD